MAIFGRKKEAVDASKKENVASKSEKKQATPRVAKEKGGRELRAESVIISPRITEKASVVIEESNAYVFEVRPYATKRDISREITRVYQVVPRKVAIVQVPRKLVFVRGKRGATASGKKAYVYLKKGDTIELA